MLSLRCLDLAVWRPLVVSVANDFFLPERAARFGIAEPGASKAWVVVEDGESVGYCPHHAPDI